MARRRSRAVDYAVYVAVRLLVCLVQALSWSAALGLGRLLARAAWFVGRRYRLVAEKNLRHAFADLDATAIDRLTRAAYRHLADMVVEILRLPRVLHAHNIAQYVEYARPDDYDRALRLVRSGRPVLILLGHFGNWEIFSYVTGLLGFHSHVVARRLDNPYLDRFVSRFRQRTGQRILDKNQDYERIQAVLAQGGILGVLGDQDAGARGLFVRFLGRPASTFKSIALLSLAYAAPILVMGAARIAEPMKYRVYFEDAIFPEEYAALPNAAHAITQRYTDALERMVHRHPEQYFWLHSRWKHQPKVRPARSAA